MMRQYSAFQLLMLLALWGCGSDGDSVAPTFSYTLQPAATSVGVGQDSSVALGVVVTRDDNTTVTGPRVLYSSQDYRIATVDSAGNVVGLSGGSTTITARFGDASVDIPVTVRPRPATTVELTVLTGPAGGLKSVIADTGTFYALPADPLTSRVRGVVVAG